jgi:glycosyltransferase involved in cell wall biosynthesis
VRIALILPGFSAHTDDWAIPALFNLARSLAKTHELHIFSQRYPARGLYHFDGFTHHALGGGQKFGLASLKIWLQTAGAVVAQHKQKPFDLLHAFWVDEAGFSAAVAAARIRCPFLVSLGGGELTRLNTLPYGAQRFFARRLTTRYALKRAALITAGSHYQLDLCRDHHVPEDKLKYAPLGVDTALFRPTAPGDGLRNNGAARPPTLIQAASLVSVKNQALLFKIIARVKHTIPNLSLNLVGAGPLQPHLADLARQLGIDQQVIWRQHVAYPEMARLYQSSWLYLQTSYHESQGMAVLEAMACGLPVIGTPVGVARELACLPPQVASDLLASQVIELFQDQARYRHFSHQARQIVAAEFSLPVTTGNFLKLYETLL